MVQQRDVRQQQHFLVDLRFTTATLLDDKLTSSIAVSALAAAWTFESVWKLLSQSHAHFVRSTLSSSRPPWESFHAHLEVAVGWHFLAVSERSPSVCESGFIFMFVLVFLCRDVGVFYVGA